VGCPRDRWHKCFNPRSPRGERPYLNYTMYNIKVVSIHAPREGSDGCIGAARLKEDVSIHAPREGSDPGQRPNVVDQLIVSIHAPREGSDEANGTSA